jgi:hypothetical protein
MQGSLSAYLGLPSRCRKLLFLKEFITIFGLTFTPHKSNFFWLNLIGPSQKEKVGNTLGEHIGNLLGTKDK